MSAIRAKLAHLLSPQSGLFGQMLRFGVAGGSVGLVYLTITTVLSQVLGVAFQIALAVGFAAGLLLHFTLQRVFVWSHHGDFALALRPQMGRYLTMAAAQYATTAAATALLPGELGLSTEIVYLGTMVVVTTVGFLLMRFVIFHAGEDPLEAAPSAGASDSLWPR